MQRGGPCLPASPGSAFPSQLEQDVFNGVPVLMGFHPLPPQVEMSQLPPGAKKREKRAIFIGDVRAYVGIRAQHCFFSSFSPEITLP